MAILTGGSSTSAGTGGGPTTGESVLGTLDGLTGSQVEVVGDTVYSPTAGVWNRLRDAGFGQVSTADLTLRGQVALLNVTMRAVLMAVIQSQGAKARLADAFETTDFLAASMAFDPTILQ